MRWTYVGLGFFCIGLAVLGAVLPVMPTTVFVLIAAACFARGSRRFECWLLNSPFFGPMVRSWRTSRSIPARAKLIALVTLFITFAISVAIVPFLILKIILPAIGLCVAWYIWRLPTAESAAELDEPALTSPADLTTAASPSKA
jgi:uncharacterized membrane protein YbaN (DUF454 family)